MLKRTVACGTNWRRLLLKRAAKSWAIIGYGTYCTQLDVLVNRWECMFTFMILKTNCRWATPPQVQHLLDLLNMSDVVSLHVRENPSTKKYDGRERSFATKPGSPPINASRGTVVDIPALCDAWRANIWRGGHRRIPDGTGDQ
ncbi:NAD(P)-dependent oxidoreductase [Shigella flexneri]